MYGKSCVAEFALRRQWASLAEADRQRFIEAFQRLSVTTYAARFGNVAADAFRPIEAGAPAANGRVQVTTAIKRDGQPDVGFEYLLQRSGDDWKIINIVADGVSDLALKRAEYQRVFASGGIEGLIAELEQQSGRFERN
jgi:phospholipid transport system substrate-binding protein